MASDLDEMRHAVAFAVKLLKDELGPGGLVEGEPESVKATWGMAIDCLRTAVHLPRIPLDLWKKSKVAG